MLLFACVLFLHKDYIWVGYRSDLADLAFKLMVKAEFHMTQSVGTRHNVAICCIILLQHSTFMCLILERSPVRLCLWFRPTWVRQSCFSVPQTCTYSNSRCDSIWGKWMSAYTEAVELSAGNCCSMLFEWFCYWWLRRVRLLVRTKCCSFSWRRCAGN